MAKTNFYLVTKPDKKGEHLIYLNFRYSGNRLRYSTAQNIKPANWNLKEQRANRSRNNKEYDALNDHLDKLEALIKEIYRKAITDSIQVNNEFLIGKMDSYLNKKVKEIESTPQIVEKSFEDCFNEYIEDRSKPGADQLTERTLNKYRNLLNNKLKYFSIEKKYPLTFQNVNEKFYQKYIEWCVENNQEDSTTYKEITSLKAFFRWANKKDYFLSIKWRDIFKSYEKEKEVIALSDSELNQLSNFDFSPNKNWDKILKGMVCSKTGKQIIYNESWGEIRDCFLFSIYTGLRFSDYFELRPANIREDIMYVTMRKGDDPIQVYVNKYAREILEKYSYSLPKYTNVHFNRELKHIGQAAGLNKERIKVRYVGGIRYTEVKPMYDCITHHKGRASMVTMNLQKGIRHEVLMTQTGHRKLTTLKKYIFVDKKMIQSEMEAAWK